MSAADYMPMVNMDADSSQDQRDSTIAGEMSTRDLCGFFLFGVINNTSYVIMIAGAKEIDASMVGLIYLCSEVPSLVVKLTGPYWFHRVSYRQRVWCATLLMAVMFLSVALGGIYQHTWMQLIGVCIGSAQSGVGESSFLALASFYNPTRKALTAWSSGTGFAGIFGYAWVVFFTQGLRCSFPVTLFAALALLPAAYLGVFELLMHAPSPEKFALKAKDAASQPVPADVEASANPMLSYQAGKEKEKEKEKLVGVVVGSSGRSAPAQESDIDAEDSAALMVKGSQSLTLTLSQRFGATARLWPYMVPLATVYAAEYCMQAGVWSAMGFPVTDASARKKFYEYANWCYQAGVVISRSSGTLWTPTRARLWFMPAAQCIILVFSIVNAYRQLWYDWSLLALCFVVGLLGGSVYVGGFSLIAMESPAAMREFNLGAASVANSAGVAVSDAGSIFLQAAIYRHYGIAENS